MKATPMQPGEPVKKRFRRVLQGKLDAYALDQVQAVLEQHGYTAIREHETALSCEEIRMDLVVGQLYNWVETGADLELDYSIDQLFVTLMKQNDQYKCTCSDCNTHFVKHRYRLFPPRHSDSCEFSYARHPRKIFEPRNNNTYVPRPNMFQHTQ